MDALQQRVRDHAAVELRVRGNLLGERPHRLQAVLGVHEVEERRRDLVVLPLRRDAEALGVGDRLAGHRAGAEHGHHHVADLRRAELLLRVRQGRRGVEAHRGFAGVEQLDSLVELQGVDVVVEEALLLQLLQPRPVLVVARLAPVELADEEVEGVRGRVEVLGQRVHEVPLAEEPVLDAAADRDVALRLQLLARGDEPVPVLRRILGVEARGVEVVLVVLDAEADGVEADPVLLALEHRQLGRARVLEHVLLHQPVESVDVAEPDVLHVVDAVEEELDVRRVAGRRGVRELRDHVVRVQQRRRHRGVVLGLELVQRVVDPFLDADRLLLAPPPHLEAPASRARARGGLAAAAARGEQRAEPRRRGPGRCQPEKPTPAERLREILHCVTSRVDTFAASGLTTARQARDYAADPGVSMA